MCPLVYINSNTHPRTLQKKCRGCTSKDLKRKCRLFWIYIFGSNQSKTNVDPKGQSLAKSHLVGMAPLVLRASRLK
jgi:hypothetical protein